MTRPIAVVTGGIATFGVGGVAWDYGQYVAGLERLGVETYYLEDTGLYCYDPRLRTVTADYTNGATFVQESLRLMSPTLATRWHIRGPDGHTYGMAADEFHEVVTHADVYLNVSGISQQRSADVGRATRVFIDTDPGKNQLIMFPRQDRTGVPEGFVPMRDHEHFFTYAACLGKNGCSLPDIGIRWTPTLPPVVLDQWNAAGGGSDWTTVLTWEDANLDGLPEGRGHGSKSQEFHHIEHLPARIGYPLEIAIGGIDPPCDRLREAGWKVRDGSSVSGTADAYREYIHGSRGELSVAKGMYVATRSGWFSCRSVCYLASGRPVVVQDTGFSETIPVGEGLFAFSNTEEAAEAITAVEADYGRHASAARELAERVFASDRVLGDLLEQVGAG